MKHLHQRGVTWAGYAFDRVKHDFGRCRKGKGPMTTEIPQEANGYFEHCEECCRSGRKVPVVAFNRSTGEPRTPTAHCCYCGCLMKAAFVEGRWFFLHP